MRTLTALLLILSALWAPPAAWAQRVNQAPTGLPPSAEGTEERIAAVVNDSVISTSDVRARGALALLTSNLPDTPDVRQKLLPQVLHSLIDEQLEMQEGKRLDITVTADDVKKAMDRLAQDNNIPGGDMAAFLTSHGIPPSAMEAQARASLIWGRTVQRELRPRVDVGDDEVDAAIARMRANVGKEEYRVSEIYLAVDHPADEDQVRSFAASLVEQIKSGAAFGAVAHQFSQSADAATGGDMGWIQTGQLAPDLDKALKGLQAGQITDPVRSTNGFHILGVREKRAVSMGSSQENAVALQQAFRPFASAQDKADALKEADKIQQTTNECKSLKSQLSRDFPRWHWQDLGTVKVADAPSWLMDKTRTLAEGHASDPILTDKGALVVFMCGRTQVDHVDRDAILNSIGTERIELLARRLLRDLRRDAYIDVRL